MAAPRSLVQRRVALPLRRVEVEPALPQPVGEEYQLLRARPRHGTDPVLRAAGKRVELARVDAARVDEVARHVWPALPHRELERRDGLPVARIGVDASVLDKEADGVELSVACRPVQRPPPLAARRDETFRLGVAPTLVDEPSEQVDMAARRSPVDSRGAERVELRKRRRWQRSQTL